LTGAPSVPAPRRDSFSNDISSNSSHERFPQRVSQNLLLPVLTEMDETIPKVIEESASDVNLRSSEEDVTGMRMGVKDKLNPRKISKMKDNAKQSQAPRENTRDLCVTGSRYNGNGLSSQRQATAAAEPRLPPVTSQRRSQGSRINNSNVSTTTSTPRSTVPHRSATSLGEEVIDLRGPSLGPSPLHLPPISHGNSPVCSRCGRPK